MGRYSDLLYAQPSFLEGVGRLVDFAGLLDDYNYSDSPEEADQLALAADWWALGEDMRNTISEFASRHDIELHRADSSAA